MTRNEERSNNQRGDYNLLTNDRSG